MPLSSETYRRLAAENGYQQESLEKVVRLGELLAEIGNDSWLGEMLSLRGGTALNLMQERPPRLSVDLDFDYVGAIEREKMIEDKPKIINGISKIGRSLAYQTVNPSDSPAGSSLRLRYRNSYGTPDEVKVDVSWTNRVHVGIATRKTLWQPIPIERPSILVAADEDLIGGKFRALIDRVAARDVFDAVGLAESHQPWPPPPAQNAFVFLSGTLSLPLTRYGPIRLDRLHESEATQNLEPMLAREINLHIPTLMLAVRTALASMLILNEKQLQFVEALEKGELRPELIFDANVSDRLRQHPHLLWKVRNVRKHLSFERRV